MKKFFGLPVVVSAAIGGAAASSAPLAARQQQALAAKQAMYASGAALAPSSPAAHLAAAHQQQSQALTANYQTALANTTAHAVWNSATITNPYGAGFATTSPSQQAIYYGTVGAQQNQYQQYGAGGVLIESITIHGGTLKLPKNRALKIAMEDGSFINVDPNGSYTIDDLLATVVYRANRVREFNRFLNASDLLAEFIAYLGTLALTRGEVQQLPVGLFINWLIIRAAETDGDDVPADIVPVPQHRLLLARVKPRCLYCARYIPRKLAGAQFPYCNPPHAERYHQRLIA